MNHFWIVLIGVTTVNALIWWHRAQEHISRKPEALRSYKRLIRGLLIWGNIPWVVMGLGSVLGGTTMQDYLEPRGAKLWVLAWYAEVILSWVLLLWWVFTRGGARVLVDHPGLLNIPLSRPWHAKALASGSVLVGIAAVITIFSQGTAVPFWTSYASQGDGYTTVFVIDEGFWRVVALAAGYVAIGVIGFCVAIVWIPRAKDKAGQIKPVFILVWSILWLSLAGLGFSANLWQSYKLLSAYRDGRAHVTEGIVQVLREQPFDGHAKGDLVQINTVQLEVDYFTVSPAYKQTIARGGELRQGRQVRVWHCNGKVLRLDLQRENPAPPKPSAASQPH